MGRELHRFTVNIGGSKVRREVLEGRNHLVAEGAIIPDGVMHGSEGPINYPQEHNVKSVPRWNHMPIVVFHPKIGNQFVSARTPNFINSRKVGLVLNTRHADGKVRTEFWFDEDRTKEVDDRIHTALIEEKPIEASTGLGANCDRVAGEVNGVKYNGTASEYEPDHVAVLPDGVGAFSVAMGGGIFANAVGEMSFEQIRDSISSALEAKFRQPGYSWNGYLLDVFDGYFVYCMYDSEEGRKCYRVDYSVTNGKVEITSEPVEVSRSIQYTDVKNGQVIVSETGVSKVPEKEKGMAFDKKVHVNSLVGNGFEEADRSWLDGLPDDKLQKILPKPAPVSPPPPPPPVVNQNPQLPTGPLTMEQLKQILPPQFFAVHEQGQKALANTKKQLIEVIKANPNNKFTDEFLNNVQDLDMLAGMAELARGQAPSANAGNPMFQNGWDPSQAWYGGAQGATVANQTDLEAPPEVPDIFPVTANGSK